MLPGPIVDLRQICGVLLLLQTSEFCDPGLAVNILDTNKCQVPRPSKWEAEGEEETDGEEEEETGEQVEETREQVEETGEQEGEEGRIM